MTRRKLISNVNKIEQFIKTNIFDIKQVITCQEFMETLKDVEEYIEFTYYEDEDGMENWLFFGAPIIMSRFISGNQLVVEMNDGQFVILQS